VGFRVAAELQEREVVGPSAVALRYEHANVVAVVVDDAIGHAGAAHRVEPDGRPRQILEALGRVDLDVGGVIDRHERRLVEEHRFLELVGDANLVSPVSRDERPVGNPDVLVRVRRVELPRSRPVTHLATAEKVGDELEAAAVPGEEIWTRRRLAIEFLDPCRRGGRQFALEDA
jgi:hypothetical protein